MKAQLQHLAQRADEADQESVKYQQLLTESEKTTAGLRVSLERSQQRMQELQQSGTVLRGDISRLETELKSAQETYLEINETNRDENNSLADRDREVAALEGARNTLAALVNDLRLNLSRSQAESERMRRDLSNMESRKNEAMERIQSLRGEDEEGYRSIALLQQEAEQLNLELDNKTGQRRTVLDQREQMQRQSQRSLAVLKEAEAAMHHTRLESDGIQQALSAGQIELGSVRNDFENIAQRIQSQYELDLSALEKPEGLNAEEAQVRIEDLRLRVKKLGPINFAAYDELRHEEERFGFMSQQRDDLLKAKEDLLLTIKKIDETARAMFLETLEGIKKGFVQIFQRLFIGGDAQIRLIGSDDPLEAEIEILATPEGKSMKSITLLSGGEKTLTATALLFGIYLVKPAPFCVLDEVDAPLDDANVQRFCSMLRDFSSGTQFLVITHNKRTMEVADRLYGVTMEQAGISRVVSVKFD